MQDQAAQIAPPRSGRRDDSCLIALQRNNRKCPSLISLAVCALRTTKEINDMNHARAFTPFLLGSAALMAGALIFAGCNKPSHPDEKAAVNNALTSANLGVVSVSQDRDKGVITLSGNVDSQDQKSQAETVAKQAAPDYTIADEIGVRPPQASNAGSVASNIDSAIEDNFKAAIKAHENLNDQSIRGSAKNGTLEIKGSVKTVAQKREAEKLGKSVPNVQQVVNLLEVKPDKHSSGQ
jgi:hyperosmotically inducible protein